MSTRNIFRVTDISKLYNLGFIKYQDVLLYKSNGKHRIWVHPKRNNIISFIHHNFDTYNVFKKMCELNIIEITTMRPYNNRKIEQHITNLESMKFNELEVKIKR